MAMKLGTNCGGIRALRDLKDRCFVDYDTGCWHWRMGMSQGAPRVHFITPDTGERVTQRGRRAALYLCRGCDLRSGHVASPKDCNSDDCVNPAHCQSLGRKAHGALVREKGWLRNLPQMIKANRQIARSKLAKITIEQAREIRESDEPISVLMKRYGLTRFPVSQIKLGKAWKEDASGSSIFNWRPS